MNRLAACLLLVCSALFSGCASGPVPVYAADAPVQKIPPPPADKAQIIFIQPFVPIGAVRAYTPLYELKGAEKELLGIIASKGQLVVNVSPGKHVFMNIGNFLDADVRAGKRYYVLNRFVAYAGYEPRPVRRSTSEYNAASPEFKQWLVESTMVETTPEGRAWAATLQQWVDGQRASAWEKYQKKTPEERAQLSLNPDDDIAP